MTADRTTGSPASRAPAPPEFEVLAIRYGTRTSTKSRLYLNYPIYGEPDDELEISYFVWIIRDGDQAIVVDTGYSPAAGRARGRHDVMSVPEALGRAGVDPAAVSQVIITHAHDDHMGNLDLFPNSAFIMAEAELAFWTGPIAARAQFAGSVEPRDIALLRAAEEKGRIQAFQERMIVTPGVEVIRVGGHTPGQLVVKVNAAGGAVLLCSDAVHFYDELREDRPFAYVADLVAMYEAFDTIRAMLDTGEIAHAVPGHDGSIMTRFPRVPGELDGHAVAICPAV